MVYSFSMNEQPTGLRERTRRAVQAELLSVALELFLTQGYEATTLEQIAEAGGLSRRSFFRYFASKDDLLAATLDVPGKQMARNLEARPRTENPWVALRRGMDALVKDMSAEPRALAMTRMMLNGDALRASYAHKQERWRSAIAFALAPRLDAVDPANRALIADALAGAAIAALSAAEAMWVEQDGRTPLAELLDTAMAALHPIR